MEDGSVGQFAGENLGQNLGKLDTLAAADLQSAFAGGPLPGLAFLVACLVFDFAKRMVERLDEPVAGIIVGASFEGIEDALPMVADAGADGVGLLPAAVTNMEHPRGPMVLRDREMIRMRIALAASTRKVVHDLVMLIEFRGMDGMG